MAQWAKHCRQHITPGQLALLWAIREATWAPTVICVGTNNGSANNPERLAAYVRLVVDQQHCTRADVYRAY